MLDRLLPKNMLDYISDINSISELRVRADTNLIIYNRLGICITSRYIVRKKDIEEIILTASGGSLYSVNENINKGFLVYDGGIRIGLMGEGVLEDGKIICIKNISYLTIRIPKEIDIDIKRLELSDYPKNVLIISPPGGGKTTLLRAITKYYSDRLYNTLLIDERYELAATKNGKPILSVGKSTDILSGVPKSIAYELAIRTMRPDIISTDELYEEIEADALIEACYCGIKIFATVHARDKYELAKRPSVSKILGIAEQIITLSNVPSAGTINDIEVVSCYQ